MKKAILDESNIIRKLGDGIESDVYLYEENGFKTALKIFKDDVNKDNKELKIELLSQEKLILKELKLLNRIYKDNKFIGYTSIYTPSESIITYMYKAKNRKIDILNQLQKKYQDLNKNDIYIGDFNLDNFRVKDGIVKLIDIDNFSIDGIPFDVENPFMSDYIKKCNKLDNIDYYCFNYFALSFMTRIIPPFIESIIIQNGLPKNFNNKECQKILYDMCNINDDYKKEILPNGDDKTFIKCMKKGLFK